MNRQQRTQALVAVVLAATLFGSAALAQMPRGPRVVSPEVTADGQVTFRILAPNAKAVRLTGGDMPQIARGVDLKNDEGVWEATVGPVDPGATLYVQRRRRLGSRPTQPATSESLSNVWSLVYVPGAEFMDTGTFLTARLPK